MTQRISAHLSEEDLDDVVIGMGSRESQTHLDICEECRSKLREFRTDINLFNETSMAWTEATTAKRDVAPQQRMFRIPTLLLGLCAIAMLLVIVALPSISRVFHESSPVTPVLSERDSQEQIAQDNELMKNVEAVINPDEASVVDQYHLMDRP